MKDVFLLIVICISIILPKQNETNMIEFVEFGLSLYWYPFSLYTRDTLKEEKKKKKRKEGEKKKGKKKAGKY